MRAGLSSPRRPFPFFRRYGSLFPAQWSGRVAVATDLVIAIQIGVTGFEPATSWSQTTRSTKLSYTPHCRLIHIMRGNTAHPESYGCGLKRMSRCADTVASASACVSHVGFGAPPKPSLPSPAAMENRADSKVRAREDAIASTRDPCALPFQERTTCQSTHSIGIFRCWS
jgi:hypothetical protein